MSLIGCVPLPINIVDMRTFSLYGVLHAQCRNIENIISIFIRNTDTYWTNDIFARVIGGNRFFFFFIFSLIEQRARSAYGSLIRLCVFYQLNADSIISIVKSFDLYHYTTCATFDSEKKEYNILFEKFPGVSIPRFTYMYVCITTPSFVKMPFFFFLARPFLWR